MSNFNYCKHLNYATISIPFLAFFFFLIYQDLKELEVALVSLDFREALLARWLPMAPIPPQSGWLFWAHLWMPFSLFMLSIPISAPAKPVGGRRVRIFYVGHLDGTWILLLASLKQQLKIFDSELLSHFIWFCMISTSSWNYCAHYLTQTFSLVVMCFAKF